MTVKASVENQVCNACGADVRPGTLFCYSCGAAVASELKTENGNDSQKIAPVIIESSVNKPIGKPVVDSSSATDKNIGSSEPENKKLIVEKEEVLPTAATVRKQAKPALKKSVEVIWEQPENSVNILFVIATLILIILALGALMAMLYLR